MKSKGFTLVELLVAITIFSLVVGLAMFSLRFSFGVLRHLNAPFAEDTQQISRLRDCIASAAIHVGERTNMFDRKKEFYTFFYGEAGRMTFISSRPVALGETALCRLSLLDGDLVLEEAPLYGVDTNYLVPQLAGKGVRKTVLFSQVRGFNLEYYQGDKKVSALQEEMPSLVRLLITTDGGAQEYFCKVQADFAEKKYLFKAANEPPI
jgi:prepilin-type N-terminal cleavage/methylation domain-containing protein